MDTTTIKVRGSIIVVEVKNERGEVQSYNEIHCRSHEDAEERSDAMALTHRSALAITAREKAEKPKRKRTPARKPGAMLTPEQLTAKLFKK